MNSTVRYVDPHAPRGRLYRAWVGVVASPLGLWLSRHIGWKVDPYLLKLTGGRLSMGIAVPIGLLETRGARTRRPRQNGVIYFHDGERVTIVASKAGAPEHPSWFHNARANPDVRFGGQPFRAEVVDDEAARERLWQLADRVFPPFATYRASAARSGRTIPILQLVSAPAGGGGEERA
jgi:deazaflavin-dependent oxidoreductase (nitroreductase family)